MTIAAGQGGSAAIWRALSLGISPILAFLLVVLTPVGTGQGVHRDQLVDPVFPHFHFLGRLVASQMLAQLSVQQPVDSRPQGVTLGAAAGAGEAGLSLGQTPVVPGRMVLVPDGDLAWRIAPRDALPVGVAADPPPDPPPDPA